MTIVFTTGAVVLVAAVFYRIGYSSGEMDGYTNAVEDIWPSESE
jgi:hypothetical protein